MMICVVRLFSRPWGLASLEHAEDVQRGKCGAKKYGSVAKYRWWRCPKVCVSQVSHFEFFNIERLTANDKDFSLPLEMTRRGSDVFQSLTLPVTSH